MRLLRAFLVLSLLLLPQMANAETLMMATTTSTQDTGLLEYLQPIFKKDTGIDLKWISVGTGKALAHGKDCDVDVLLVHAPALEEKFVADGFGVDRHQVMYNDFVLIGPAADPAGVKGKDIPTALKTFAEKKIPFVSRGDNSGTHNTEKQLWKVAGMEVPGKDATWYIDAGQGMMATIRIAAEKDGYTVTDRGTYIKYNAAAKGDAPLKILVEGDKALLNQYSVMMVNPAKCPKVKQEAAKKFKAGQILVVPFTTNDTLPYMRQAAGIIAEEAGANSHSAIVGLTLGKPVIIGATHATRTLKDGMKISMDCARGVVQAMSE